MLNTRLLATEVTIESISAARGFVATVRPHLLFLAVLQERQLMVNACLHAWNIGALSSSAARNRAISATRLYASAVHATKQRIAANDVEMMRGLVEQRRLSFPFMRTAVRSARLRPGPAIDELLVETSAGTEVHQILWRPTLESATRQMDVLHQFASDVAELQHEVGHWIRSGPPVSDIWATRATNQCRLLVLELSTLRSAIIRIRATTRISSTAALELNDRLERITQVERWALSVLHAFNTAA